VKARRNAAQQFRWTVTSPWGVRMMTVSDVLSKIDIELLDKQISTLCKLECAEEILESQREHISGLCNFLCELYHAIKEERGISEP
jgi:hypothetical protein